MTGGGGSGGGGSDDIVVQVIDGPQSVDGVIGDRTDDGEAHVPAEGRCSRR